MGLDSLRHYRLTPKGLSKAIFTLCRRWKGICISCPENIMCKGLKWGGAWSLEVGTFLSWLKLTSSWHCEWWVQRGSSLHDLWPDALRMHGYVPPGWLQLLFTTDAVLIGIKFLVPQGHTELCVLCLVHNTTRISSDHFLQEKTQQFSCCCQTLPMLWQPHRRKTFIRQSVPTVPQWVSGYF